jgi:hypothetical protein
MLMLTCVQTANGWLPLLWDMSPAERCMFAELSLCSKGLEFNPSSDADHLSDGIFEMMKFLTVPVFEGSTRRVLASPIQRSALQVCHWGVLCWRMLRAVALHLHHSMALCM